MRRRRDFKSRSSLQVVPWISCSSMATTAIQASEADYEWYSTFVRPGGLIAFHDILPHPTFLGCKVHELWSELRATPTARELIDRDGYDVWGGIGVLTR